MDIDNNVKIDDDVIVKKDEQLQFNLDTGEIQPSDTSKEIREQTGVELDTTKMSRQQVLDAVEVLTNKDSYSQEEIDAMAKAMSESVIVPEVISNKSEIDEQLGLTAEDLKQLYSYISGRGEKPVFLDKYLADNENKLKDFQQIMTLIRLSEIPQLAALEASIQQKLYSPENLSVMDVKDLSSASANLSKEMNDIIYNSIKATEQINNSGRSDSKYRAIIDKLLVVPEDVLNQIEHILNNYE